MLYRLFLIPVLSGLVFVSCKGEDDVLTMDESETEVAETVNKGIGPVRNVELGSIDKTMVSKGESIFKMKCQACHAINQRRVGPALKGVTQRREPEWIMNLLLNTNEMVEKDPIVRSLISEYMTKMTYQNVSEEEARSLLEFFRFKDNKD